MMKNKQLIDLLKTMNPDLPVRIRLDRISFQKGLASRCKKNNDRWPMDSGSLLCDPLEQSDVVDTWDAETGVVAVELSARFLSDSPAKRVTGKSYRDEHTESATRANNDSSRGTFFKTRGSSDER